MIAWKFGRCPARAAPPARSRTGRRPSRHAVRAYREDLFTFPRQPGLGAADWRAELANRFGVTLRKVGGGSRT